MSKELTEKQKRFCDEYLIDLNATRAYKIAYPKVKKDETAASAGVRLLRIVNVKNYIQERQQVLQKKTEITQERVLEELAHIAFDDIRNYLKFYRQDNYHRPVVEVKNSEDIDTRNISEISMSPEGAFKFKLNSKENALVQLGKHLGLFKDRLELSGSLGVQILDDIPKGDKDESK